MTDSQFPSEVPDTDQTVRITPVLVDYVPRNYKWFCEESHVVSRFFAVDYGDRKYVEVSLSGRMITLIRFNLATSSWSTSFDGITVQLEVEKVLE